MSARAGKVDVSSRQPLFKERGPRATLWEGPDCNKWGAHPGKTALSANLDVLGTKNDDMGGLSLKEPDCNKWGAHPGKTAHSHNLDVVGTKI